MEDHKFLSRSSEREIAIRRRVHRLAEFYRHAFVFVAFIAALWALNAGQIYLSDHSLKSIRWYAWWAMWPTFGWGIGLLAHGLAVLPIWIYFSEEWEDRKVKEIMERDQS